MICIFCNIQKLETIHIPHHILFFNATPLNGRDSFILHFQFVDFLFKLDILFLFEVWQKHRSFLDELYDFAEVAADKGKVGIGLKFRGDFVLVAEYNYLCPQIDLLCILDEQVPLIIVADYERAQHFFILDILGQAVIAKALNFIQVQLPLYLRKLYVIVVFVNDIN